MEKSKFEQMFSDVINGKSIRECEQIYGINRNTFVTMCKRIFPEGSEQRTKLEQVLAKNKSELQRKQIEDENLRNRLIENGIKCADERNWEEIEKDIMIAYQ